jgi:hypothetical protein
VAVSPGRPLAYKAERRVELISKKVSVFKQSTDRRTRMTAVSRKLDIDRVNLRCRN